MEDNKKKSQPKNISKEQRKVYNNTFIEKNKDKVKCQEQCNICNGHYTYYNKSHHMKSKKHLFEIYKSLYNLDKIKEINNEKIENVLDPELSETSSINTNIEQ